MNTHRILLVEDSADVQVVVGAALKRKFNLTIASTVAEALKELAQNTYSLVILDVELPDGDGFKICAQIKLEERHRDTSVIFLSGKGQTSDKVMGLTLGADDYIVKPLDILEFQARVEARIRSLDQTRENKETFRVGPFRIHSLQQKIYVTTNNSEEVLDLKTMEFKLLSHLLRHEDQIFSREQLLDSVWGQLSNVTDRTVDTHIYTIRQKLKEHATCIQSVPRAGYRFTSKPETSKKTA